MSCVGSTSIRGRRDAHRGVQTFDSWENEKTARGEFLWHRMEHTCLRTSTFEILGNGANTHK